MDPMATPERNDPALAGFGRRTLLTLALTPEDAEEMECLPGLERFRWLAAGDDEALGNPEICRPAEAVAAVMAAARGQGAGVHGIIAFDDYPASLVAAAAGRALGLPGPAPESLLRCHHKYWSRLIQRQAVPEAVPRFCVIDPARPYRADEVGLDFPFWLKPIKASLSYLGFRINSLPEFERACARASAELPSHTRAFDEFLALHPGARPAGAEPVPGHWLIAEELMGGRQCTFEAFFHAGRMTALGVIDTVRHSHCPSFRRFDYPSSLPRRAQEAMAGIAEAVMRRIGFDDGLYDFEFFWDPRAPVPRIIEINPRFCSQFGDLYAKVDGTSSHRVLAELAAGEPPRWTRRAGPHQVAASFVLRRFKDAMVTRSPDAGDLARLKERLPDARVHLCAQRGDRLSELAQDAYSYRYALINLGAGDRAQLFERFRLAASLLPYEFAPATSRK